jgi:hypothetical protein
LIIEGSPSFARSNRLWYVLVGFVCLELHFVGILILFLYLGLRVSKTFFIRGCYCLDSIRTFEMHPTDHSFTVFYGFTEASLISTCSACLGYIWLHLDSTLSAVGPPMILKRTKKAWRTYKLMMMTPLKFVGYYFLSATRQA